MKIPDELLAKVSEFTSGGFMLFTVNEKGEFDDYCHVDSPIHGLAFEKYLENWLTAVNTINEESTMQAMIHEINKAHKEEIRRRKQKPKDEEYRDSESSDFDEED